jgi:DNA-binding transcriptional regulator YhcF (GntR family)
MNVVNLNTKLKQNQPQDPRRSIAKQKFAWIELILIDQEITHLAFRVAVLISKYLNLTSGDAWPSQSRLAADLGVTTRGIQKALDALVAAGYLAVEVSKGRSLTNRYRPIFELENTNSGSSINEQKDERGFAITPSKTRTETPENTNSGSIKHEPPFVQNSSKITLSKGTLSKKEYISADFESWWQAYPRKVSKAKAQNLYTGVIRSKKATAPQLLTSAMRYAAERDGEDPTFTKHPTTWLLGGCWTDEPAPASQHRRKYETASRADSALDGMRGYVEDDAQ